MQIYPLGTRIMLHVALLTRCDLCVVYRVSAFRWLITVLDNLEGTPPTWPR